MNTNRWIGGLMCALLVAGCGAAEGDAVEMPAAPASSGKMDSATAKSPAYYTVDVRVTNVPVCTVDDCDIMLLVNPPTGDSQCDLFGGAAAAAPHLERIPLGTSGTSWQIAVQRGRPSLDQGQDFCSSFAVNKILMLWHGPELSTLGPAGRYTVTCDATAKTCAIGDSQAVDGGVPSGA
jgi:hypothetical protein